MKIKKYLILLFLILTTGISHAELIIPTPEEMVSDYANIIEDQAEQKLETALQAIQKKQGIEIAVLTVEDLQDYPIDTYANQTFRQWRIGNKENNSGILYLIAPNQRESRIELGYGIEKIITDTQAKIIRESANPYFREENYTYGIALVLENLMLSIEGENYLTQYNRTTLDNLFIFFFIWFSTSFFPLLFFMNKKKASYLNSIFTTQLIASPLSILAFQDNIFWSFPLIYLIGVTTYYIHMGIKKGHIKPVKYNGSYKHNGPFNSGGTSSGGSSFGGFSGGSSGGGGSSGSW